MLTLMVSPSLKARSNLGAASTDNDASSAVELSSVVTLASRFARLRSLLTTHNKCCSLHGTEKQCVQEHSETSTKAVRSPGIRSPNQNYFKNLTGAALSEDVCVVTFSQTPGQFVL